MRDGSLPPATVAMCASPHAGRDRCAWWRASTGPVGEESAGSTVGRSSRNAAVTRRRSPAVTVGVRSTSTSSAPPMTTDVPPRACGAPGGRTAPETLLQSMPQSSVGRTACAAFASCTIVSLSTPASGTHTWKPPVGLERHTTWGTPVSRRIRTRTPRSSDACSNASGVLASRSNAANQNRPSKLVRSMAQGVGGGFPVTGYFDG